MQIQQLCRRNLQRCLLALLTATLAYCPLHLLEMLVITGLEKEIKRLTDLKELFTCVAHSLLSERIISILCTNQ
jgi:hypothetical protein